MMNTDKRSRRYAWTVVGLLWGVALLNYLDRQMLSTMKASMMGDITELQTAENFGRLMAVFLWIYGLMSPVAGLIADRVNRKWLIVGSLGVWSAVTLAMGFAGNYDTLYFLRALMGFSEALYIPAGLALIADYHKGSTRSLAIGIHMSGIYVGQALGGFGATIAHQFTWQTTFWSFGLIGIAYSLVLVIFLRENSEASMRHKSKPVFKGGGFISVRNSLGMLLGTMSFWIILFYFAAPSFPGWSIKNWLPSLFSEKLHIGMAQAGPMATITIAVSSLAGVIFGGLLADRWIRTNLRGRIFTGVIGLSLTVPALILIGFGGGLTAIICGAILFGVGFGMFDANNMPILCQFVSPSRRAAGYGLMNLTGVFSGALITAFLGKSSDSGNLGRDMAFLAIPVALAIVLQLTMLKPVTANMEDQVRDSRTNSEC
jgi:MFS family permease